MPCMQEFIRITGVGTRSPGQRSEWMRSILPVSEIHLRYFDNVSVPHSPNLEDTIPREMHVTCIHLRNVGSRPIPSLPR